MVVTSLPSSAMPRQRKHRIYWKNGRAYADFRDYALWGGRQEALRAPESSGATSDANEALRLCTRRLDELEEAKAAYPTGIPTMEADPLDRIAPFVGYHLARLEKRVKRGRMLTPKEICVPKSQLIHATMFLAKRGKHRLREITTGDVRAWLLEIEAHPPKPLTERRGGRAGPLSEATRAKYLATLNGLLRRAWREERIAENPIDRLDPDERPSPGPSTTPFLEIPDAALALEVGRLFSFRGRSDMQHYVRMAMHLLTGGRGSEVEGLEKADLDFVDGWVWFRPNATRANVNKARGTARRVPMWPQLRSILEEYLAGPHAPEGSRLFDGGEFRKWMDKVANQLGWPLIRVRLKVFRVTYASARIQTLDGGAPVSDWTVQQEMGHGSMQMLQQVYVRVGVIRQRRQHVEYRWEEYASTLDRKFEAAAMLPPRWRKVLDALPRRGATATVWLRACEVPAGTFYYIRDQLVVRGLVARDGQGIGSRFRRAVPEVLGGDAAPVDLLRAG
jgi:integrase